MRRIKMIIEYDGSSYHGFQRQLNAHTVQAELESCIYRLSSETVTVSGASRTDAGVHARGQVIAFNTASPIPDERWCAALNSYLPLNIRALTAETVTEDFHPAFAAQQKEYQYCIWRQREGHVFVRYHTLLYLKELQLEAMQAAAAEFIGCHNFSAFCSSGASNRSFERTISCCMFEEYGAMLVLRIVGNGFLYNMVRIIVGTLLEVGCGRVDCQRIPAIIASRDRNQAGPTAPPQGLFLIRVDYPNH